MQENTSVTENGTTTEQSTAYTYNGYNQLETRVVSGANGEEHRTVYEYDAAGSRTKKTEYVKVSGAWEEEAVENYSYDVCGKTNRRHILLAW